jgi:hypothetical protein
VQRYIGIDVHSKSCTVAVVDSTGKHVGQHVVESNGAALVECLKMIPGNYVHPWGRNRGRESTEKRERIQVRRVGTVSKRLAEGDAHETVWQQAETLLGERRTKHVLAPGFASTSVFGAGVGRGVQRETELG